MTSPLHDEILDIIRDSFIRLDGTEAAKDAAAQIVELAAHYTTPVGITEMADLFDTSRKTIDTWRERYGPEHHSPFPQPRWLVGNRPAWDLAEIKRWGWATHRLSLPWNPESVDA